MCSYAIRSAARSEDETRRLMSELERVEDALTAVNSEAGATISAAAAQLSTRARTLRSLLVPRDEDAPREKERSLSTLLARTRHEVAAQSRVLADAMHSYNSEGDEARRLKVLLERAEEEALHLRTVGAASAAEAKALGEGSNGLTPSLLY